MKTVTLLLVATLGLQAQTPAPSTSQPDTELQPAQKSTDQAYPPSSSGSQFQTDAQRREEERKRNEANRASQTQHGSTTQVNQSTTQTNIAVSGTTDVQVKTVVQQIDAQGPAVVQRISTRFADAACSEENARTLVEALHNGSSVTLRGKDGKTTTFTPNVKLGYGEAYIAMALAAETLRNAGISGCATPAQWQAVLVGGQLSGGTTTKTTSVQTERFPGILVLHSQGGGWSKVAQTTNVQLGQVVSEANTSLQIESSKQLSPTGHSSDYDPYKKDGQDKNVTKPKDEKDPSKPGTPQTPSQEMNPPAADDANNPSSPEQPQAQPNQ